jgi:hypothetical protein
MILDPLTYHLRRFFELKVNEFISHILKNNAKLNLNHSLMLRDS